MNDAFREARATAIVDLEPPSSPPSLTAEDSAKLDALAERYQFRDRAVVEGYLRTNPDLLDLLHATAAKIPAYFDLDEPLILEMLWDPEDEDGDELFATIPTRLGWEEALSRFNRFIRDWFVDAARFAGVRFNVALEYR